MIDITGKPTITREATASGKIILSRNTLSLIKENKVEKGNVIDICSVSAMMGVKKTPELLPHAHNIPIESVEVNVEMEEDGLRVTVKVKTTAKTGVEMDALSGVLAGLLTVWDMVKKYEKDDKGQYPFTRIEDVRVLSKIKYDDR